VIILGGKDFASATTVLRWMAPLPFITSVSAVASLQILLPNGKSREFNTVLISGGIFGAIAVWPFAYFGGAVGAAQFLILTETAICLAVWILAVRTLRERRI
jgi:PST family polysaccharide transporter